MSKQSGIKSMDYVAENVKNVYKNNPIAGELLEKQQKQIKEQQQALNEYNNKFKEIQLRKLRNQYDTLRKLEKYQKINLSQMNQMDDDYNNMFNKDVEQNENINKNVFTKDRIILMNNDVSVMKENVINALQDILLYIFLMILPIYLTLIGILSYRTGGLIIFLSFIIVVWVIVARSYRNNYINNIVNKTKNTAREFAKETRNNVLTEVDKIMCPKKCSKDKNTRTRSRVLTEEDTELPLDSSARVSNNEVSLDNSQDVWRYGNIPTVSNSISQNTTNKYKPGQYFPPNKNTNTYQCKWKYDPAKMTGMNKGLTFTTTIPCEYFPGYETINSTPIRT